MVGADAGLLPVSYFYSAVKQDEAQTYYTITTNNNIRVTNVPKPITVPASINVPIGGCSIPVDIVLLNAPYDDLMITFNYDNSVYT